MVRDRGIYVENRAKLITLIGEEANRKHVVAFHAMAQSWGADQIFLANERSEYSESLSFTIVRSFSVPGWDYTGRYQSPFGGVADKNDEVPWKEYLAYAKLMINRVLSEPEEVDSELFKSASSPAVISWDPENGRFAHSDADILLKPPILLSPFSLVDYIKYLKRKDELKRKAASFQVEVERLEAELRETRSAEEENRAEIEKIDQALEQYRKG